MGYPLKDFFSSLEIEHPYSDIVVAFFAHWLILLPPPYFPRCCPLKVFECSCKLMRFDVMGVGGVLGENEKK